MNKNKEKFINMLEPYLRIVEADFARALDPKVSDSIRASFSRYKGSLSLQEYFVRAIENRRIFTARVLKFLDESWAPYDYVKEIEDKLIPYFLRDSPLAYSHTFSAISVLEEWKLIEVQYGRVRITEYGKEVCKASKLYKNEENLK